MPLHTFLPSPAEVLPLLLATPGVTVMVVMVAGTMHHLVIVSVTVIVATYITLLFFLDTVLILINCLVVRVCL